MVFDSFSRDDPKRFVVWWSVREGELGVAMFAMRTGLDTYVATCSLEGATLYTKEEAEAICKKEGPVTNRHEKPRVREINYEYVRVLL